MHLAFQAKEGLGGRSNNMVSFSHNEVIKMLNEKAFSVLYFKRVRGEGVRP